MTKAVWAAIVLLPIVPPAQAQRNGNQSAQRQEAKAPPEEGIPVTDPLVISKCGGCHTRDAKGNMLRISWERATPGGLGRSHQTHGAFERPHAYARRSARRRKISRYLSRLGARGGQVRAVLRRASNSG